MTKMIITNIIFSIYLIHFFYITKIINKKYNINIYDYISIIIIILNMYISL
jgi:hypothetical protein